MRFFGLEHRIVALFAISLIAMQGGALLITNYTGESDTRERLSEKLVADSRVYARLLDLDHARLSQAARLLASDEGFGRAARSDDPAQIHAALMQHSQRIDAELMMLVDADHRVRGDIAERSMTGSPFPATGLLADAALHGQATALVELRRDLFQVVVVPLRGSRTAAWVVLGFAIDGDDAQALHGLVGLEVSYLTRGEDRRWRLVATTLPEEKTDDLIERLGHRTDNDDKPVSWTMRGDTYLTLVEAQPDPGGAGTIVVLQRSFGEYVRPFRDLEFELIRFGVMSLLACLIGCVFAARGIVRPVTALAASARRMASGDFSQPAAIVRADEIGDLALAFNQMQQGITRREAAMLDLAYRDALTGLPNRALFSDRLQQAIHRATRLHQPLTVLMLGLDRFRDVNDSLGHEAGDGLLVEVGRRLREVLRRDTDVIARWAGDQFAVLLPNEDANEATRMVRKLQACLEEPMVIEGQPVDLRASIGGATYPDHGANLATLLRHADVAMNRGKTSIGGFALFEPSQAEESHRRLSLTSELRRAVENDEFVVYYQPKIDLATPTSLQAEALIRWVHPVRGLVPPDEFIPFAEQTGFITTITSRVVDLVCTQLRRWHDEGIDIRVSVNVSSRDLMNVRFPGDVEAMLARHRCAAEWVVFEITETSIIDDPARALGVLENLNGLGCRFSIDDFGTGYSSLAWLRRLPVDELKIDRSFVMEMSTRSNDEAIVRSTIDLAHNMGLRVVAEGVENVETLRRLRELGCDLAQGYLMSRPLPLEAFEAWLGTSAWVRPHAFVVGPLDERLLETAVR